MRRLLLLALIVTLGFLLRFVYLGSVPAGFTPDEANQGYAAHSLLKTGLDEWGLRLPLTSFRAFADYRAPLQTYLIVPSVALFGLSEFAVRLPSAIFGTLAIIAVYLLANKLFPKTPQGWPKELPWGEINIGHLAALFVAISPWSIQFSRTALEANFASFLFPLGLLFFLKGVRGNSRLLLLSAVVLGLDLYSYLAAKLFVPLFILAYLITSRRQITKDGLRRLLPFLIVFTLFAAPLYIDALFGPGNVRGKDLAITNFSLGNLTTISNEQYFSPLNTISPQLSRIFSNKIVFTFQRFIGNYVSYLSPTFWFTEGGREITYAVFPGYGLLHLWLLPLIIFAFYRLFVTKEKNLPLLLFWLFLAIIPAAITKEGYRPNRIGSLLTFWEIIAAYGLVEIFSKARQWKTPQGWPQGLPWGGLVSGVIILVSLVSYLNLYFFIAPAKYPSALSFGYRDLLAKIKIYSDKYTTIVFDRGSQAQIFVAFYNRLDPTEYQSSSATWWPRITERKLLFLDMLDPYSLGKYTFKTFDASRDLVPGNLVVIRAEKANPSLDPYILDKVEYPDRTPAFYLLAYDQKQN